MGMKGGKRVNRQTKASLSAGGVMGWGMGLLRGWWTSLVGADTGYSCWFKKRGRTDANGRGNHEYIEWWSGESAFSLHDGRSDSN